MKEPAKVLSFPLPWREISSGSSWKPDWLQALGQETSYTVPMSGRGLEADLPEDHAEAARILMRAMLPLAEQYPAPFFRV